MRADGARAEGAEREEEGGRGAPEDGLSDPIASLEVRIVGPRRVDAVELPYVRAHRLRREHGLAGTRHLDRGAAAVLHGHGDSVAAK